MNNQPMDKRAQIENSFKLHSVKAEQIDSMGKIRDKAKEFALLIADLTPSSREQSVALTQLEESVSGQMQRLQDTHRTKSCQ